MEHPNGEGGGGMVAENDVLFDDGFDAGEEVGEADGVGMRGDGVEEDSFVFHNGFFRPL